jgi:hypothetical protein
MNHQCSSLFLKDQVKATSLLYDNVHMHSAADNRDIGGNVLAGSHTPPTVLTWCQVIFTFSVQWLDEQPQALKRYNEGAQVMTMVYRGAGRICRYYFLENICD